MSSQTAFGLKMLTAWSRSLTAWYHWLVPLNDDVEATSRVVSDSKYVGSDSPSASLSANSGISASLSGSEMRGLDVITIVIKLNVILTHVI